MQTEIIKDVGISIFDKHGRRGCKCSATTMKAKVASRCRKIPNFHFLSYKFSIAMASCLANVGSAFLITKKEMPWLRASLVDFGHVLEADDFDCFLRFLEPSYKVLIVVASGVHKVIPYNPGLGDNQRPSQATTGTIPYPDSLALDCWQNIHILSNITRHEPHLRLLGRLPMQLPLGWIRLPQAYVDGQLTGPDYYLDVLMEGNLVGKPPGACPCEAASRMLTCIVDTHTYSMHRVNHYTWLSEVRSRRLQIQDTLALPVADYMPWSFTMVFLISTRRSEENHCSFEGGWP